MRMKEAELFEIHQRIQAAQRLLIVSHVRPDGDAVGSLLGLGLALRGAGKEVRMVLSDGVPPALRFLPGSDQIRHRPQGSFDLICTVDCSDLQRVGEALSGYPTPDINIDHHVTNMNFGKLNLVDPAAVATAEMIARLLPAIGVEYDQTVASALLTGIITDTLGFRTANMTPDALRCAADLMEKGADLPELYRHALVVRSFEAALYWGSGLKNLEREGRMVWATLTQADRQAVGYPGRDDADLITLLSSISDADIAMIFVEQPDHRVKVSWRSKPGVDVSKVALSFGGGGHPAAAGAEIPGDLEEVRSQVLRDTRAILDIREERVQASHS